MIVFELGRVKTISIATTERRAIIQKSPSSPILEVIIGPIIKDNMKATPIWNPTKAFAFALLSSEIESAKNAINTAEIAPPPWNSLPITTN